MEREAVTSSNLVSVGYEADTETLEVEFKNGLIYQYFNVPQFLFEQMMHAASIGSFFNTQIRNVFAWARA